MHAENHLTHDCTCRPRCEVPAVDRLNYFTGQFLAERDFRTEQDYHVGKHRNHNRHLHGWGAVCGLKVVPHPNPDCPDRVVIRPGLAVDCCGREIGVDADVCVDLVKLLAAHQLATSGTAIAGGPTEAARFTALAVSVCYRECAGEQAPALYSECGCGEDGGLHPSRIHETFEVKVEPIDLTKPPGWLKALQPPAVKLKWSSTLNLDGATRAAASPDGVRLYVVTDAEQGVLHAYDTANGCLHATRAVTTADGDGMRALGVAVSPDGARVYVFCRPPNAAAAAVEHLVLAFDAEDLAKDAEEVGVGAATPTDRDAIACDAAGSVFVLVPGGADKQRFYVAKRADTQATAVDTGGRKFAAMAMAAGGRYAFLSFDADPKAMVYDRTTGTLVDVSLDRPADRLAVSADEKRLLAAAGAAAPAEVRAYDLDATGKPATPGKAVVVDPAATVAALAVGDGLAYVATTPTAAAATSHGEVRAVDLAKFGAAGTVSEPEAVVADPRQVVVAAVGGRVYVVGRGAKDKSCGGVSVLESLGGDCSQILWRQLDGCPPCDAECVPLALIVRWQPGRHVAEAQIHNEFRPLLPSTNTLRDLILCCCGGHKGPPPTPQPQPTPEPQPTPDPQPPAVRLTRLVALSWRHNTGSNNGPIAVDGLPVELREFELLRGLVVGFDGKIDFRLSPAGGSVANVDAEHVFQVMLRNNQLAAQFPFPAGARPVMWFPIAEQRGDEPRPSVRVVPVVWRDADNDGVIDQATFVGPGAPDPAMAGTAPTGLAYLFTDRLLNAVIRNMEMWVRLHGDYVRDAAGIPADVDFVRLALRTTNDAVQPPRSGGVFESWLSLRS